MAKRRKIRGKKLLIVSGALVGASMMGCGDSATANLLPPPDTGTMDSSMDAADTSTGDTSTDTVAPIDAPVANLIAPPDVGPVDAMPSDAADDGSADAG
jgi:hypothetical protein